MATQPSPEQILTGYQATTTEVRRRVLAFVEAAWRAQGSYRDADVRRLVALIVPRVQAGQVQIASLTAAYIAALTGAQPVPVDRAEVTLGRGVAPEDVYRRPAVEVYTALAAGAPLEAAVGAGMDRLSSLAATDLQMAKVRQARTSMRRSGVQRYRRVLNGPENCALCMLASTQRYWVGDLSPIHPGCDCGVEPLPRGTQRGQVIDPDRLAAVHDAVAEKLGVAYAGGRGVDYRKLVLVREHGEYGPTLTMRAHRFTNEKALELGLDVPRAS